MCEFSAKNRARFPLTAPVGCHVTRTREADSKFDSDGGQMLAYVIRVKVEILSIITPPVN